MRTPLFILTALSLGALYYVVAALQLWITPYLHGPPLNQPLNTIVIAFSLTSASAPVLGLLTGGWFMDHVFGGYRSCITQTSQVQSLPTLAPWEIVGLHWCLPALCDVHVLWVCFQK